MEYNCENKCYIAGASPCVQGTQKSPKTACGSDEALLLMQPQSWPNHWGGSNTSNTAHNGLSKAVKRKRKL